MPLNHVKYIFALDDLRLSNPHNDFLAIQFTFLLALGDRKKINKNCAHFCLYLEQYQRKTCL